MNFNLNNKFQIFNIQVPILYIDRPNILIAFKNAIIRNNISPKKYQRKFP